MENDELNKNKSTALFEGSNNDYDLDSFSMETVAVRAGQVRSQEGEHSEAIYPTSSFVFDSAEQAAKRFSGEEPGNIYSRFTNPTVRNFEQRLAAMEGGERGVATASGMSAILSICLAFLQSGDEVVCSRNVFGTTVSLFNKYMAKFGVKTIYVDLSDQAAWENSVGNKTKLLFIETPSNPLGEVADISFLATLAHKNAARLVVDNCFCTPVLQRPISLGADLVMHSATKFIDGQGRCVGGAVIGGNDDLEEVYGVLRTTGQTMSPFNAWVFLKGLETLSIRMRAHCDSAEVLANWLQAEDKVEKVYFCGLKDHAGYDLAKKQQSRFGAVLSFEVKGGKQAAWSVIDATQIMSITTNLGDAKTTISHPATTSHGRLTPEEREQSGIKDNLVRISVGLENVDDLIADLQSGLAAL